LTEKNSHTSLLAGVALVTVVVYFLLIPAMAQPEYRGGLPIISDPNYFVKPFRYGVVTTVTTAVTTATSSLPYWQTAFLTQTATQTQTQTVQPTQPGISGASCSLALPGGTDINMGQPIWGQVGSNRAGREVVGIGMLLGEPSSSQQMTLGLTDANGQLYASSPAFNVPGLYQISASIIFGADVLTCVGTYVVTVHGLLISVNPDSIPKGILSDVTIEVFSDHPGSTIQIQDQTSASPSWTSSYTVTTNAGGHGIITLHIITGSNWWKFRAIDPVDGSPSVNEEWLSVT